MRIAFIVIGNSRRSNYLNGETLRYGGGGGSGTDTSSILIAEYLASQGHEVVFASERLEPHLDKKLESLGLGFEPGKNVRGVCYTDIHFTNVPNKEFDILVSSLWFVDYKNIPIKISKGLIYWSHMQWIYGVGEIIDFVNTNNLKLGIVNISEWEKKMNQNVVNSLLNNCKDTISTIIPNPIMDDVINEVLLNNPKKKKHKFIFHAAWARGGDVAVEAVRKLNFKDCEFHAFDYLLATHAHSDSFFKLHNSVDKKTLFTHLAESEYFIYPLYTPYQDVHKDTFSCVIAEAIALGCIPVTYPLGALPENFDGYCAWLDFPPGSDPNKMQNEPLSKDIDGIFKYSDNIVSKVNFLEENPEFKNKIIENGKDYILEKFNKNKVGDMWKNFINSLLNG